MSRAENLRVALEKLDLRSVPSVTVSVLLYALAGVLDEDARRFKVFIKEYQTIRESIESIRRAAYATSHRSIGVTAQEHKAGIEVGHLIVKNALL